MSESAHQLAYDLNSPEMNPETGELPIPSLFDGIHAPGIYFGMSDEEYHADQSFSTSGIKMVLSDPEEYWHQSHMNPNRPPREVKDCLDRGTLRHCRILQPEKFDERYIIAPQLEDGFSDQYDVLTTVDDMKGWLDKQQIEYKKSGKKSDFEAIIEDCKHIAVSKKVWLSDKCDRDLMTANPSKTIIYGRDILQGMYDAERVVLQHPQFSKVLSGGQSEVAIFWVDQSGIPMKAKIDKLKPGAIIDYKTLYVQRGKSTKAAALGAIKWEKYDLQAAVYTIGIGNVVQGLIDGTAVIEGDPPGAFIDELKQSAEKPFAFVFQKEDAPYTLRGLRVARRGADSFNAFGNGLLSMQQGIETFLRYRDMYGKNRWYNPDGITDVLDTDIYYGASY